MDFSPEAVTDTLCLNPQYPVSLSKPCKYILDSGAFQDVSDDRRLSFKDALARQLKFELKLGQFAEAVVSYDRLVDEQKCETGQFKSRVSESIAEEYVNETVNASRYLSSKREILAPRKLILSCQGSSTEQYLRCLKEILEFAQPEDIIGFGGFCIISRSKIYEEQFYEIIKIAFPMIAAKGIKRVHLFGVGMFRVLLRMELEAKQYGLECSYDTSSAELNAVMGRVFDPSKLQLSAVFSKDEKNTVYHPAKLALLNIRTINHFWKDLESGI